VVPTRRGFTSDRAFFEDYGPRRGASPDSLITTAKLNVVEPFAYLKDVLEPMSSGHPTSRLDELLPWNWTSSNSKIPTYV
jgi:hypothetical protein